MYGFIFGFQRLVWWPKWTPASIMSRIVSGVSSDGISVTGAELDGVSVVVSMFSFRVVSAADVIEFRNRSADAPTARAVLSISVWCSKRSGFYHKFPTKHSKGGLSLVLPLRPFTC